MAKERNHDLVRRFYFWQMRQTWMPLGNSRTRIGRLYLKAYGALHESIVWMILRLP
jgi:hypothetical protein